MIKTSTGLALAALTLSLLVHVFGIGVTFDPALRRSQPEARSETVALGDSFEEIVDLQVEPVTPEPLDPVDPPEPQTQPDVPPKEAEVPTTEVLVASPNPRPTLSPDTGVSQPAPGEVTAPVTPPTLEASDSEEPRQSDDADTGDGDQRPAASDAPAVPQPPVTPPVVAEPPAPAVTTAPSADVIAALPPIDAQPPVNITGVETVSVPEAPTASLRPQVRPQPTPSQNPVSLPDPDADAPNDLAADIIESPLTAYSRDGIDLFAGQRQQGGSQRNSFAGGRGPGNSDVTNYAGQVLVHLNRTPLVAVAGRGWARVSFVINPDGTLGSVDIIDGSGSPEIDRAAKAQTRMGVPFPLPPGGERRRLNFVYRLN